MQDPLCWRMNGVVVNSSWNWELFKPVSYTHLLHITLPMLSPVLKVILMLAITTAFKDYQSILVLTNGGPNNRSHVMFSYIYNLIFSSATTPVSYTHLDVYKRQA